MASYQDTILADNPVFYSRLNDPVGTTTITDISGFGNHGTYYGDANLGLASPIETEPGSTAGGPGHVGFTRVDNESLGEFSWEVWLYYAEGMVAGAGITRGGQQGLNSSNWLSIDSQAAAARITISGSGTFDLTSALPVVNRWYHLVVTRNGNVMRLYVNGALKAERTDLGLGDLAGFGVPSDGTNPNGYTFIGTGSSADVFASPGTDEPAIYNYALNATPVLTHYEAALNTLFSSATIKVRVQVTLDTDALEPLDFAFAHNWTEPISGQERVITEHLSWKTHGNQSEPDYQQRVNARPHGPRRSVEYAITPTSSLARMAFQRLLWQPAQAFRLPIWTDWTPLTTTANATDTTLDCDTTLRDFEIGSYCVIFNDPYDPSNYQFFKITSRNNTQLGVSPSVTTAVTNGLIAPARLANLPAEELSLEAYVIDSETGVLNFDILDTELSNRRVTTYTPTSTYQPNLSKPAVEVLSLDSARYDVLEQVQYSIRQRQLGTGLLTGNDYYRGIDTATSSTIPVRVLLTERASLSEFYGWLEARQGRQNPVWVPSRENDLQFVAHLGGPSVKIKAGYLFYNLHYGRRDVQITYADNSVQNVRINAVTDNMDGTETLTMAASVGGTIAKISWLRFCVAPDSFELRFHRDITIPGNMIVECAWEFTELLTTP